jgi:hypothetical protein
VAVREFALNTEPHVAKLGETELLFQPEVMGDEFLEAYACMRDATKRDQGVDIDNLDTSSPESLRSVTRGLRLFLAELMLPASAELITRLDIVVGGEVVESFRDLDEATEYAAGIEGAKVRDALRVPMRHLMGMLEFTVELYAGGKRPPTSSGDSATPSRKGGRRGMGVSPSRVSTPTAGR